MSTLGNLHPHCGLGLRGGGLGFGFPRMGGAQKHRGVPRVEADELGRSDLRKLEVDRGPVSAGGGGATPSQRTVQRGFLVSLKKAQTPVMYAFESRKSRPRQKLDFIWIFE